MDLRKRLARLDGLTRKPGSAAASVRGGAALDHEYHRSLMALGLVETSCAEGVCWVREDRRPEVPPPAGPVPVLDGILPAGVPAGLRWDEILFLDTETTGLAGGTGTLVFLVGLAWWSGDALTVRQLFLSGPGREAPLLADLSALAGRFRVVATYNGGSFDLPLLRTRALLSRRDDPCANLASWDLLTAARRLWGRGLPDCRQQTVEQAICGRARGPGDIEGALIPAAYQAYLQTGAAGCLPEVLRHNRRDMDGLGLVLGAVARAATELAHGPQAWAGPWQEAWGRALVAERRRDPGLAAAWAAVLARAAVQGDPVPLAGLIDAIRLLKRAADWPRVADLVRLGLTRWPGEARLHYEGAVLYEHRLSDPDEALRHATALGDPHRLRRLQQRCKGR